jgi:hypothetical protein
MCFQIRRYLNAIVLSLNKSSNVVMTVLDEHIQLFISLFKGREDVFAVRANNKSPFGKRSNWVVSIIGR